MKTGDKVLVCTFMDAAHFPDLKNHAFTECTTQKSIYTNMLPSIIVRTDTLIPADEWSMKMDGKECTGQGLAGILGRPFFYMRKVKDFLGGLISNETDLSL